MDAAIVVLFGNQYLHDYLSQVRDKLGGRGASGLSDVVGEALTSARTFEDKEFLERARAVLRRVLIEEKDTLTAPERIEIERAIPQISGALAEDATVAAKMEFVEQLRATADSLKAQMTGPPGWSASQQPSFAYGWWSTLSTMANLFEAQDVITRAQIAYLKDQLFGGMGSLQDFFSPPPGLYTAFKTLERLS